MAPAASELLAEAAAGLKGRRLRSLYAIVGGFVADAAATPTHWVYDAEKLAQSRDNPQPDDRCESSNGLPQPSQRALV